MHSQRWLVTQSRRYIVFNISKALIIGAVAILSANTASAQDEISATFRYNQAVSVEANYDAFALTAKRACDQMSALTGYKAHKKCSAGLLVQAVTATKLGSFIAYHQNRMDAVQIASSGR
jgi:hypothetical protein